MCVWGCCYLRLEGALVRVLGRGWREDGQWVGVGIYHLRGMGMSSISSAHEPRAAACQYWALAANCKRRTLVTEEVSKGHFLLFLGRCMARQPSCVQIGGRQSGARCSLLAAGSLPMIAKEPGARSRGMRAGRGESEEGGEVVRGASSALGGSKSGV